MVVRRVRRSGDGRDIDGLARAVFNNQAQVVAGRVVIDIDHVLVVIIEQAEIKRVTSTKARSSRLILFLLPVDCLR